MGRKLLYGVGVNDSDTPVVITKKVGDKRVCVWVDPSYRRWCDMLKRCYSKKYPTYKDCEVCEEWLTFSNFRRWVEVQDWEGKELDKDILVEHNKVYSPSSCIFVDPVLNRLTLLSGGKCRNLPLGVTLRSHVAKDGIQWYVSKCRSRGEKTTYLGKFKTQEEAHKVWQITKQNQAIYLQSQQTCERTKQGLQRIIDKLQHHIDNNIETKDL